MTLNIFYSSQHQKICGNFKKEYTMTENEYLEKLDFEARKELLKRCIAKDDILGWGKIACPEKFNLPFCKPLHNYFIDIRDDDFTSTLSPRESAKTTVKCFLIPLYEALNHPKKYNFYLNVQATSTKATDINNSIKKELEENELLRSFYGDMVGDKWTEKLFILKNGVIFGAVGAGESIRGKIIKNKRPDYIIVDDLYDEDDKYRLERINKKNIWFWATLYPARNKSKNNCIHVQGTAIHKKDLMHELSVHEDVKFRKFQAILNFDTKEVLWPELNTFESLMKEKVLMGSSIFYTEMQNDVRDDETSIIKESYIRFYNEIPAEEDIIASYLGIDPSIGDKDTSDFTGMAVIIKTKIKNTHDSYRWYIRDICNEHLTMQERINTSITFHNIYKFTHVLAEGIAGFKDFVAELKRTTNLPVKEISSVKNKIANLEAHQSKFENHKIFIYDKLSSKKKQDIIEQLINNYPEHDDVRDAILLCLNDKIGGGFWMSVV